jgi:hypothetical protein
VQTVDPGDYRKLSRTDAIQQVWKMKAEIARAASPGIILECRIHITDTVASLLPNN